MLKDAGRPEGSRSECFDANAIFYAWKNILCITFFLSKLPKYLKKNWPFE